jgi:hypothetical protein
MVHWIHANGIHLRDQSKISVSVQPWLLQPEPIWKQAVYQVPGEYLHECRRHTPCVSGMPGRQDIEFGVHFLQVWSNIIRRW